MGLAYSEHVYFENTCACRIIWRYGLDSSSGYLHSILEVSEKIKDVTKKHQRTIITDFDYESSDILHLVRKVDSLDPSKKNLFIKNFFVDEVVFPNTTPNVNELNKYIEKI